jgi:hypothetical protein
MFSVFDFRIVGETINSKPLIGETYDYSYDRPVRNNRAAFARAA